MISLNSIEPLLNFLGCNPQPLQTGDPQSSTATHSDSASAARTEEKLHKIQSALSALVTVVSDRNLRHEFFKQLFASLFTSVQPEAKPAIQATAITSERALPEPTASQQLFEQVYYNPNNNSLPLSTKDQGEFLATLSRNRSATLYTLLTAIGILSGTNGLSIRVTTADNIAAFVQEWGTIHSQSPEIDEANFVKQEAEALFQKASGQLSPSQVSLRTAILNPRFPYHKRNELQQTLTNIASDPNMPLYGLLIRIGQARSITSLSFTRDELKAFVFTWITAHLGSGEVQNNAGKRFAAFVLREL